MAAQHPHGSPDNEIEAREVHLSGSIFLRSVLVAAGFLFLGLGIIGIFLPLLPTTPFLLLTAACFARGSDRSYRWLMRNRVVGPYIRDWREHRSLTRRTKLVILSALWATFFLSSVFVMPVPAAQAGIFIIPIGITLFLSTIPTRQRVEETSG